MRFTKRSLERAVALALGLGLAAITSCATVTRSSEDPPSGNPPDEAGAVDASGDAGDSATPMVRRDGGARRRVKCAGAPCAVDLATPGSLAGTFCALLESGRVACWGSNEMRELGRGEDAGTAPSGRPAFVEGVSGATMLDGRCAVVSGGGVMCWGDGAFFQDGGTRPTPTAVMLPIPPAKRIRVRSPSLDDEVGCALLVTGEVMCWGLGAQGLLDDGTVGHVGTREPAIVAIETGAPIVDIAAGDARFALRADGVALSWGSRRSLGRASSLPIDPYPTPVALSGVSDLDAVSGSVCASANGHVSCWGERIDDVTSAIPERPTPELVAGLPNDMIQVSTPMTEYRKTNPRACAAAESGDVYCWGDNQFGQAGDGTRAFAFAPVKVVGLPEPAVMVRATEGSTCALLESGRVYCWGDDIRGSLGRGTLGSFDKHPAAVVLP